MKDSKRVKTWLPRPIEFKLVAARADHSIELMRSQWRVVAKMFPAESTRSVSIVGRLGRRCAGT
jgi:hypothetical protein